MRKLCALFLVVLFLVSAFVIVVPEDVSATDPTYTFASYFPDTGDDGWTRGGANAPAISSTQKHSSPYSMRGEVVTSTSTITRSPTFPTAPYQWSFWLWRSESQSLFYANTYKNSGGSNQAVVIRITTGGGIEYYNHTIPGYSSSGYTISTSTWQKFYFEVQSDGIDFKLYFNNATSYKYCHGANNAGSAPDRMCLGFQATASGTFYVDDIKLGTGMNSQESYAPPTWAPTFTSSPDTSGVEDEVYAYNVAVNESSTFTYISGPWWLSCDHNATKAVSWWLNGTPTNSGSWSVKTKAVSYAGTLTAYQNYTLVVGETDYDFNITSVPIVSAFVGMEYYYYLSYDNPSHVTYGTVQTNASWLHVLEYQTGYSGTPTKSEENHTYWVKLAGYNGNYVDYQNYTIKVFPGQSNFTSESIFRGLGMVPSGNSGGIRWGDRLFVAYQGIGEYDGGQYTWNTSVYAQCYNYTLGLWTYPVRVGWNPHEADVHGTPFLFMDQLGYIHIFFGCHFTDLKHARSTEPYSMEAFVQMEDLDNTATYPSAYVSPNGTIYAIFRDSSPGQNHPWSVRVSYDDGSSWTPGYFFVNLGEGHALYMRYVVDHDKMWFSANDNYYTGSYYADLSCFYLNLTTLHVFGVDGTDLGLGMDVGEYHAHAGYWYSNPVQIYGHDIQIVDGVPNIVYGYYTAGSKSYQWLYWDTDEWVGKIVCSAGVSTTWPSLYYLEDGGLKVYITYFIQVQVDHSKSNIQLWSYNEGNEIWEPDGIVLNDSSMLTEKGFPGYTQKITDRNQNLLDDYVVIIMETVEDGEAENEDWYDSSAYCKMFCYDRSNSGMFYSFNGVYSGWEWSVPPSDLGVFVIVMPLFFVLIVALAAAIICKGHTSFSMFLVVFGMGISVLVSIGTFPVAGLGLTVLCYVSVIFMGQFSSGGY
jgi:hypothetical protein